MPDPNVSQSPLFHRDRYQALVRAARAVVDADNDCYEALRSGTDTVLRHAEARRVWVIKRLREVLDA